MLRIKNLLFTFASKFDRNHMLKIQVKEGENIERALKRYKNKFRSTQVIRKLREKKQYIKPTVANRTQKLKAAYIDKKFRDEDS